MCVCVLVDLVRQEWVLHVGFPAVNSGMQSMRECVLLAFCGSIATTILLYVGHNHLASEQCYSFSCWLGCVSPQSQGSCWNSTLYSLRLSEHIHRSSHSTVQHNELGNVNLEISR